MARKAFMAVLGLCALTACGQAPSDESVGSSAQALDPDTAVTFGPLANVLHPPVYWDGSRVELLAADAYAACNIVKPYDIWSGAEGSQTPRYLEPHSDAFLDVLSWKMRMVYPNPTPTDPTVSWRSRRLQMVDPSYQFTSVDLEMSMPTLTDGVLGMDIPANAVDAFRGADEDVRSAGYNLCMALVLRRQIPGSASGAALLMNESEQLSLLETIRERAQIAALQYGLLTTVLTAPLVSYHYPISGDDRLGLISNWLHNLPSWIQSQIWNDFGVATELSVLAAQEASELIARNRSSNAPMGHVASDRGDRFWGSGTWYQRELALLFGGDPLALQYNEKSIWPHYVDAPGSGVWPGVWPGEGDVQEFHTELQEAQPQLLMTMAKARDLLTIKLKPFDFCTRVDAEATATGLYESVEKRLRDDACTSVQNNACVPWTPPLQPMPDGDYWLLQKYGIAKAHARALGDWLAEALGCANAPSWASPANGAYIGALAIDSTKPFDGTVQNFFQDATATYTLDTAAQPPWIHLAPHAELVPRPLRSIAPLFTKMSSIYLADLRAVNSGVLDAAVLGFNGQCDSGYCSHLGGNQAESKRELGAVPAMGAISRQLRAILAANPGADVAQKAAAVLDVAASNSGGPTLSLRPDYSTNSSGITNTSGDYYPTVVVDRRTSDISCNGSTETCTLYVMEADPNLWRSQDLAAFPNVVMGNGTYRSSAADLAWGQSQPSGVSAISSSGNAIQFAKVTLYESFTNAYTFVLKRVKGATTSFSLLASNVRLNRDAPYGGQELAFDGSLGEWGKQQATPRQSNPVEPAFDGFGWETHMVPPMTAGFFGGDPSQSSVDPMMKLAETSADESERAVDNAISGLLDRLRDQANVAAAQAKSSLATKQERDALCGPNSKKEQCDYAKNSQDVAPSVTAWYGIAVPQCVSQTTTTGLIDCLALNMYRNVEGTQVRLAQPVLDRLLDGSAPAFAEYSGGSLQAAFIEQWRAVHTLGLKLQSLRDRADAAKSAANFAATQLAQEDLTKRNACTSGIAIGVISGISTGFPAGVSCNLGPALQAINQCKLLTAGMEANKAKAALAMADALASFTTAMTDSADLLAALQQSAAKVRSLVALAAAADARANLDVSLAEGVSLTSFPLYRSVRDADLWRARTSVESARRYALAARRAIEARYVVDLSLMNQKETFVASPALWADDVYGYDLSLPSALGMSIPVTGSGGTSINKSVVRDYVANLRGFVNGYAASRPSAIAAEEVDVIQLPGTLVGPNDPAGGWSVHCPGGWIPIGAYAGDTTSGWKWNCGTVAVPGPKADRARLGFALDPWGRLSGTVGDPPYAMRYNARWGRLAVNFVGTGVKDCSAASDPLTCYSNAYIRYDLTHSGPATVTDYDGLWRIQDIPRGQIEGGKGLAAEIWLDPLKSGWSTQYISAIARTEYNFRPLGGAYSLEFEILPEVVLQRIERVQILVGASAWVKQN